MNCSIGYEPDIILRFPMPIGPFVATNITDCSLHSASFTACCIYIIILSICSITYLCYLETHTMKLEMTKFLIREYVFGFFMLILLMMSCLFFREQSRWWWAIWASHMSIMIQINIFHLIHTQLRFSSQFMGVDIEVVLKTVYFNIPSRLFMSFGCVLIVLSSFISALAFMYDENVAKIFWQLHCIGWVIQSIFGTFAMKYSTHACIQVFEHFSISNSTPQKIIDFINRLKFTSKYIILAIPFSSTIWILHTFLLPMTWYFIIIHAQISTIIVLIVSKTIFSSKRTPTNSMHISKSIRASKLTGNSLSNVAETKH